MNCIKERLLKSLEGRREMKSKIELIIHSLIIIKLTNMKP